MNTSVVKDLYPSTLFHFTNKYPFHKILLNCQFNLSYAREKIMFEKHGEVLEREFAIPMVSFCDLRLSELDSHILNYGKYGIGLSKEWANRNDLNPVFYINKSSDFTLNFMKGLLNVYTNLIPNNNELSDAYLNLLNTYRYMKNYENVLERINGPKINNYRFANEREWRYVPKIKTQGIEPFISKTRFENKGKGHFNRQIDFHKLSFRLDDIKYLIVEKEKVISPLIEHLKISWEHHGTKSTWEEGLTDKIISRILTVQQIKDDI